MDQRGIDAGCTGSKAMSYFDGDRVCQLWSFMSATNDQYVWITDVPAGLPNTSYKVMATATAEGDTLPLLQITFSQVGGRYPDLRYMQFDKNNETYKVEVMGSVRNHGIKAVKGSDGNATKWLPIRMQPPNEPYWAFQSDQKSEDEPLYLSSDGNGNMQLKRANTTKRDFLPPEYNPFIDPALLFRAIDPLV